MKIFPEDDEYGIVMIKPDAVERGLEQAIRKAVKVRGMVIVAECTRKLTAEAAAAHSLHPFPEYIAFLTRSPMRFLLVRGKRPSASLHQFKKELRHDYNCDRAMQNLVHTADDGTEYYQMLRLAFPRRNPALYANHVDQAMTFDMHALSEVDRRGRIHFGVVLLKPSGGQDACLALSAKRWNRLQLLIAAIVRVRLYDREIGIACWLPRNLKSDRMAWKCLENMRFPSDLKPLISNGAALYLYDWKMSADEASQYRMIIWEHKQSPASSYRDTRLRQLPLFQVCCSLADIGMRGVLCFRPSMSLLETEYRMDIARLCQLHRGGGSAGDVKAGCFGVSMTCYDDSPMPAMLA